MKNKQSIAYFLGREQQTINLIKNRLIAEFHPQVIFFVNSVFDNKTERSILIHKSNSGLWAYQVTLLLVFHQNSKPTDEELQKFRFTLDTPITLNLVTCTLTQMHEQLSNYSLFFTWVRAKGIVLYAQDGALLKLPNITFSLKNYQEQMNLWHEQDPTFSTAYTQQLQPLPEEKILKAAPVGDKHKESQQSNEDNKNIVIRNYGTLNLNIKKDELET